MIRFDDHHAMLSRIAAELTEEEVLAALESCSVLQAGLARIIAEQAQAAHAQLPLL